MKKISIIFLCIIITICANAQTSHNEINKTLNEYIKLSDSENSGIIIGVIDYKTNKIFIDCRGDISKKLESQLISFLLFFANFGFRY